MAVANRDLAKMRCFETGLTCLSGTFTWNSTTVAASGGAGFTVAHTTTGIVTITLADKYASIPSVYAGRAESSTTDNIVQIGAISESAGTIVIQNYDISGAALADAGGQTFHFNVWAKNSNATP